jgi:hypothetical protein
VRFACGAAALARQLQDLDADDRLRLQGLPS